ncbi:MAG TPA: FAD-dependent monooxygenase [Steroidobacteraceae bacterium]
MNGTTRWMALRDMGYVKPGEKILILGATGGLGSTGIFDPTRHSTCVGFNRDERATDRNSKSVACTQVTRSKSRVIYVNHDLEVLIIGAGTGGLCLAQGLALSGLNVRVFERDRTPTDRLQGYRLHISATGNRALQACLPAQNFARFVRASAISNTAVTFLDHRLNRLLQIDIPPVDRMAPESERPISRIALRKILLEGLEETVAFDKTFLSYQICPDGRVSVRFKDGSTATGDIVVGADGANSHVRAQLLPNARRLETGIVVLSGKFPLDGAARKQTPAAVFRGPTLVMGPDGCFLFASVVEYPPEAPQAYDHDEYVMWGFSGPRELLAAHLNVADLTGEQVRALALAQMNVWHPELRRLIERADSATMTSFDAKSAEPMAPWRTGAVTLLGDAVHNMTPFRGMGANMALRDAAALREALVAIAHGQQERTTALGAYEREMIEQGFAAVAASLTEMHRLHARSPVSRLMSKLVYRTVDTVKPVQSLFRGKR